MLSKDDVRTIVLDELRELLDEDMSEIGTITGSERLADLELNSLSFARLVIRLEAAIGADPFASGELSLADVDTVDGLITAYVRAGTAATEAA